MNRFAKIASFAVGGVLSIAVLVLGFATLQRTVLRAEDQVPRDVLVDEITTNSVRINWTTGTKTIGVVEYGTSPTALNSFAPETQGNTSHETELTLLSSATTYYFQIAIGGKKFDNGGVPWTFTTKDSDAQGESGEEPTAAPKSAGNPTPIATIVIRTPTSSCREVYCSDIKDKLGRGCTTQDYIRCIRKLTPTPALDE